MIVPLACGIGVGIATTLWLRVRGQRHPPLAIALAQLSRASQDGAASTHAHAWRDRIARRALRLLETLGYRLDGLNRDLAVLDQALERHALDKVMLAWIGLVLPTGFVSVAAAGGVHFPVALAIALALGGSVAGFVIPDVRLRRAATQRRRELRAALSSYLELVVITLAGGAGTETALFEAASVGTGPAYAALRGALESCRYSGSTPWSAFAHLGQRLGVEELTEFAAAASLAGEHGAPVRDSLIAKAASMREHQLATAESDAESATEQMTIPLMMLLAGFVGFLGYPAFIRVLTL